MILKFRMPGDGKSSIAWRLIDKVRKIDYKFIDESWLITKRKAGEAMYYINTYPAVSNPKAIKRVAEIYIVFENGVGDTIYTDDMVFVMNDNGKTCSTINVNLPA